MREGLGLLMIVPEQGSHVRKKNRPVGNLCIYESVPPPPALPSVAAAKTCPRESYPPRHRGTSTGPPCLGLLGLQLTRVIQELSPPWAPMMYRMSREVVATKQNTDTNITQPCTRGMGTREEAMRIQTRPPKTCSREQGGGDWSQRRAKPTGGSRAQTPQSQ